MAGHTPGPWEAIGTDPSEGGDWFWIKAQPSPAMRGYSKEIAAVNGSQDDPVQQSNAHLIASAPELLEALEECSRALSIVQVDQGQLSSLGWECVEHAHESATSAIAKAKGES